jgi:hypothetical protein
MPPVADRYCFFGGGAPKIDAPLAGGGGYADWNGFWP